MESREALTDLRSTARARDRAGVFALLGYLLLSLVFFGRGICPPHFFTRFSSGGRNRDPSLMMWALKWWPYALTHRLDPFLCKIIWSPSGVNLGWVTSMPLIALCAWPLTHTLGPVGAFNVLSLLAPALAGWSAFLLARHFTARYWPSMLAGYIFGFSPYMLGHLFGQLFLLYVFPVPLAVLLVALFLQERLSSRVFVPLAAVLLFAMFGISLEIFAIAAVFGSAALALAYAVGPDAWKSGVRRVLAPLGASYGLAMAAAAPYLYHLFAFGFPHGSLASPKEFSCDLVNFLIPTPTNLLGANPLLERVSSHFPFLPESDAYVALPLAAIAFSYLRPRWNTGIGRMLAILLGVLLVCSLGPRLHVAGHMLLAMPWGLFHHFPLLRDALPDRFMLFVFLTLAVTAALWMSDDRRSPAIRFATAAAVVVFMLPNPSAGFWTRPVDTPAFFSTGLYRKYLAKDETVVILPYGNLGNSMLWQAQTGMYFRMAEGHTAPTVIDDFQKWPIVDMLASQTAIPDPGPQLKAFLAAHNVSAVIVADTRNRAQWEPLLSTLGTKPVEVGGVLLYRIPPAELAPYRNTHALDWQIAFNRARFEQLLIAAERYVSSGRNLSGLTPFRAEKLGLLPANWTLGKGVYDSNGLWLGPWRDDEVSVGIVASYDAVTQIIKAYGPFALGVYFPYPRRLNGRPGGGIFMRKLVMVFDRQALARAAAEAAVNARVEEPAEGSRSLPPKS